MKLLSLKLQNFQGIKDMAIEAGGMNLNVYGDNATGKTTIFNAFTWLLFDKASTGAKNFNPKTKGPDGDMHNLEHAAEARVQTEDGRIVSLRKVLKETYKKVTGTARESFTGHTIDHFIDGVPVKEKEYIAAVTDLCGGKEKMQILSMPNYFPEEMSWSDRRKILLELCGDITDDEVISGNDELAGLRSFLLIPGTTDKYYAVDDYKKIAEGRKREINKSLQSIPSRIDEVERSIPDIMGLNKEVLEGSVIELEKQLEELKEQRRLIISGENGFSEYDKEINRLQGIISSAEAKHLVAENKKNSAVYKEIELKESKRTGLKRSFSEVRDSIDRLKSDITNKEFLRAELLERYERVKQREWDDSKSVCTMCGQLLPEDKIHKMKEDFLLKKSNELEAINEKGNTGASKEIIEILKQSLVENEEQLQHIKDNINLIEKEIIELNSNVVAATSFFLTDEYLQLQGELEVIRKNKAAAATDKEAAVNPVDQQISDANGKIYDLKGKLLDISKASTQQARIKELEQEEENLSAEYEQIENGIYLCELFIRSKVNMLNEKINQKFSNVRFELFKEQVNGGLSETCEVLIPAEGGRLIPYSLANSAARINAGLEIIETLASSWGISMPVFVDNAESVTSIRNISSQLIKLIVWETDKQIRIYTISEVSA